MLATLKKLKCNFPAPTRIQSPLSFQSVVAFSMVSQNLDLNKWYDSLKDQALNQNDKSVATWIKYKSDLEVTKSLLSLLPVKVSHKVMVPLGPKALVRGKIVHTNEYLVNLGETWFVKRSATQTAEICDRRIKNCDEMLKKLEMERELILNKRKLPKEKEAFGNEERPEIIEYVTKEEDEAWRKQHRLNEKKYRQQLAELKNKEKKPIKTEEDLWKHLDELELQEELEDELNRLNANDRGEDESENELESEPENSQEDENSLKDQVSKTASDHKSSRRVSFACDFDLSDDEPLRLEIKHTDWNPKSITDHSKTINSPADIYTHYLETVNRTPLSVLKSDVNPNKDIELEKVKNAISYSDDEMCEKDSKVSDDQLIFFEKAPINVLNDVVERNSLNVKNQRLGEKDRKVSKFKASRKRNL